jgi:hypothetical protein
LVVTVFRVSDGLIGLALAVLLAASFSVAATVKGARAPKPVAVPLDPHASDYVHVLGDDPATVTMRSGFVTLAPGAAVGRHNTESYEEAVVVLAGEGELRLADGTAASAAAVRACLFGAPDRA